ncbi:helix-turn-helix domain-containing protein [Nocardia inohanensis]|uniref:helix-turn-helix domain-containing protein n=1 Tax=Nocardia inohanensis TaxID=209246 RepID=UPI001471A04E|nr:helix-turn-helix domain-containing protein [Nocardia inohanensis]
MSGNPFGEYLRQRRKDAELTREQLADRANVSASLIEKIERGSRPATLGTLRALFDELDVPALHRRQILARALPDVLGRRTPSGPPRPTSSDLADLDSLGHPAGFFLVPTFTLVAVNRPYLRLFPGVQDSPSLIEWMFLDPNARTVLPEWTSEAHRLVYGLRMLEPGVSRSDRTARIIGSCGSAPEWQGMWANEVPTEILFRQHVLVRDPAADRVHRLNARLYNPEFPDRPWWLYRLIPAAGSTN